MTATQWLEVLLTFSLQVFMVVLAGSVLERAVSKPGDRCAIWNACFVSILLLACAGLVLPRLHLIRPWTLAEPTTLIKAAATEEFLTHVLFMAWCIGAFISLVIWLIRGIALRWTLMRCQRLPAPELEVLLGASHSSRSRPIAPAVLISDDISVPFCLQLHRPMIVLPRILLDGSGDDLRNVLLHELAHLRNNHPLQLFLQNVVLVICWFHPAIWRASHRASLMREYTCDDAVVGQGVKRAAYLRTLLHIVERCETDRKSSAIGFGKTPAELALRAKRLVEAAREGATVSRGHKVFGKGTAICFVLVTACLLTQISIPSDPMSSSRTAWSSWPTWTAKALHSFGVQARDYERFDRRVRVFEQLYDNGDHDTTRLRSVMHKRPTDGF